jgi:threonine synthase
VRETDGVFVRVDDEEILAAIPTLARGCGVFAEPAAAAAYAGLVKAVDLGKVKSDERVVVLATGSGLKDVASAIKATKEQPQIVKPTLHAVTRALPMDELGEGNG